MAKPTVAVLAAWIKEQGKDGSKILFPSARGGPLSSDSVQYLATKYAAVARKNCPSLSQKRVSPHVLRHTAAMELLQAGVDRALIALWLGHESVETTQVYFKSRTMPHGAEQRNGVLAVSPCLPRTAQELIRHSPELGIVPPMPSSA